MSSSPGGTPPAPSDDKRTVESTPQQSQDVWSELFGIVHGLAETMGLALQAFTPGDDKAVSAITKKRLALRSLQGLKTGQQSVQALVEHLQALQAASQTWQRSMVFASKSHQELMEQIESTTEELHSTNERLRVVEAQRLAAVRDAESLRSRWAQQEALLKDVQSALKQREDELETLQFSMHELQASAAEAQQKVEQLTQAAARANEHAAEASVAMDDAKAEASKAQSLSDRHQQVVAKLTADNLVFLMQLKKAEADLAAANQERAQLRLAAEQQRGPWFDQVRAGVEERVRLAMQRSQELEAQMERREAEHATQMEAAQAQRSQLEEERDALQRSVEELQQRLASASHAKQRAEEMSVAAEAEARELRHQLEQLAAENRVLQESLRSMRQECTERWVNEQAALGRVGGLEERAKELERQLAEQAARVAALQRQVDTQAGVNRQLMAKKEEVEWQLMAALAKVDGGAADGPVPLNLQVSGLLQVGGPNQANRPAAAKQLADRAGSPGRLPEPGNSSSNNNTTSADGRHVGTLSTAPEQEAGEPWSGRDGAAAAGKKRTTDASDGTDAVTLPTPPPAFAAQAGPFGQSAGGRWGQLQQGSALDLWRSAGDSGSLQGMRIATSSRQASAGGASSSQAALLPEPTLLPQQQEQPVDSPAGQANGVAWGHNPSGARPSVHQSGVQASASYARAQTGWVGAGAGTTAPIGQSRAGAGLAGRLDMGGSEGPMRWTSVEVSSTVVSSPPSSIALSTELGSPREVSRVPSAMGYSELAQPGSSAAAAVTIRTVSTGTRPQPSGTNSRPAGNAASDRDAWANGRDGALQPMDAAAAAEAQAGGVLVRRGSLHEGGDVWLADAASTTSSDDSDMLFGGGIMVVRGAHEGGAGRVEVRPPPHQAILHELQQQLQAHLQGPPAVKPGAAGPRQSTAEAPQSAAARDMQPRGVHEEQDEVIHVRSGPRPRPVDRSDTGVRVGGFVMRTAPSRVAAASAHRDAGLASPSGSTSIGGLYGGRTDAAAAGVFSIVKGSGLPVAARTGATGSPVHPVFSATSPQASRQAHAEASGVEQAARFGAYGQSLNSATANAAPAPSGAPAPESGRESPLSLRVQAGPPFYATAAALTGTAADAIERWASSGGAQEPPAQVGASAAAQEEHQPPPQQHQQLQQQQYYPQQFGALSSPRRPGAPMSPRSPPHPAIYVVSGPAEPGPRRPGGLAVTLPRRSTEAPALSMHHPGEFADSSPSVSGQVGRTLAPADPNSETAPGPGASSSAPSARPRVSFHGIAGVEDGAVGGLTHMRSGSVSSSVSSLHAANTHGAGHGGGGGGAGGGLQTHKSGSVKSVRFSDHDSEDWPSRQSRPDAESRQGNLRSSLQLHPEGRMRSSYQRAPMAGPDGSSSQPGSGRPSPRSANATESPGYRSRGPVPHPAIIVAPALDAAPRGMGQTAGGLSAPEMTPSKRLSAAGVAVTAVPRG